MRLGRASSARGISWWQRTTHLHKVKVAVACCEHKCFSTTASSHYSSHACKRTCNFQAWRDRARALLLSRIPPDGAAQSTESVPLSAGECDEWPVLIAREADANTR